MKREMENRESDKPLIVGLGASAGGLEALSSFFQSLPSSSGMAFIVVLHLAPERDSNLTELLQKKASSLEMVKVSGETEIKPEHVYVIPPDKLLSVEDNHLKLSNFEKEDGLATVDLLFRTLAEKKGKYSVGVILSGTGSDGRAGMQAIKEHGGITFAQIPDEARYSDMPLNTIRTGVVDKILPVKEIAGELLHYRESLSKINISEDAEAMAGNEETNQLLFEIYAQIRSRVNHDFSNYRRSSILRRIDRRMRIKRIESLEAYLAHLKRFPDEIDMLYKDLLISVTNFFRDPEAFKALEEQVIPHLFEGKERDDQLRVWVPGCATGEEAYSIAMLLQEYAANQKGKTPDIQIFASDVDKNALKKARAGRYPKSIERDLKEERLYRFFDKDGEEYVVKPHIRNMILFAAHDMLRNPPFSKLDLITCRNLLIYLNRDLQSEVFNLFHYALRPGGWLFLGKSDSRLGAEKLFNSVDKKYRIYRQQPNSHSHSRMSLPDMPLLHNTSSAEGHLDTPSRQKEKIEKMHWRLLAKLYGPQSILITEDYEVLHATEGIKKFLEYKGGAPSQNILEMVKPYIRNPLRSLLFQLQRNESPPAHKKVRINNTDQEGKLELIAHRFNKKEFPEGGIHLVIKEISGITGERSAENDAQEKEYTDEEANLIELLERELEYTKEQLQLSVEEYETSNEELRTSNEELQSMNEELQSTTEELETSKEELQSVNEELKTSNEELEKKIEKLDLAYNDLENLMEATEVGIIFVDSDYCLRRFTPATTDIFNLLPSDKGRPLHHITHSLKYDNFLDDISRVMNREEEEIKKAVSSHSGSWYLIRLRPYKTIENELKGTVITFTEFTELKEARETIEQQRYQESLATLGVYALEQDDFEMVMHRAVQQSCMNLQLECAFIAELNPEKDTLKVIEEAGCNNKEMEIQNDAKWDVCYALQGGEPVVVLDYREENRFTVSPLLSDHEFICGAHALIKGTEETYGVFCVYADEKREFRQHDLHFIQVVANIIGMSIERNVTKRKLEAANFQLMDEMKQNRQHQKDLVRNNIIERWELGGYLHDNLGQMLASAKIITNDIENKLEKNGIDLQEETAQLNAIIDEGIEGIRNLTHDIIPVDIEEEGVAYAFHFLMRQTQKLYNVKCMLKMDKIINDIKNRKLATHLYHVIQEAMKNAVTHGKAKNIVVAATRSGENLMLEVTDDGIGLSNTKNSDGKGLRIMKYRMELLGGTFDVEDISDTQEGGTRVTVTIPMEDLEGDLE